MAKRTQQTAEQILATMRAKAKLYDRLPLPLKIHSQILSAHDSLTQALADLAELNKGYKKGAK